jgi:outer membrane protein assembly factor BamA
MLVSLSSGFSQSHEKLKFNLKNQPCLENAQFPLRVDTIIIDRNWRTRDLIILKELTFSQGDTVTRETLMKSISRIWNMKNFVDVKYCFKKDENGRNVLWLTARDAFTIVPIVSIQGSRKEYSIGLGIEDNNLLGRNIRLRLSGKFGTLKKSFGLELGLPRQLLYRNMTLSTGFNMGEAKNYLIKDKEKQSGIAYDLKSFNFSIGNPNNEDDRYTFSPDLHLSYFNHATDSTLLEEGIPVMGNYVINELGIGLSENYGVINQIRHQKDGFAAGMVVGTGIGLDQNSKGFFNWGASVQYYKLLNKWAEFYTSLRYNGTTSDYPSLYIYRGPSSVRGILTGEIAGKQTYVFNIGVALTYVNRNWYAIEESFYFHAGNGTMLFGDLFNSRPVMSVGTGFRFMIPMIPWAYIKVDFTYSGKGNNWFFLDM